MSVGRTELESPSQMFPCRQTIWETVGAQVSCSFFVLVRYIIIRFFAACVYA